MAGRGRITVLILVIAALAASGCSPPTGSIGGSPSRSGVSEGLMIVSPLLFRVGDTFDENTITVYTVTRTGERSQSPVTPGRIRVIEKRGGSSEVPHSVPYDFLTVGVYNIEVKYGELTARYPIEVKEANGTVDNQDSTIIILWEGEST